MPSRRSRIVLAAEAMAGGGACSIDAWAAYLATHLEFVHDGGHAASAEGGADHGVMLGHRVDPAAQGDDAAFDRHVDMSGFALRVAGQRGGDLAGDVLAAHAGLDHHLV